MLDDGITSESTGFNLFGYATSEVQGHFTSIDLADYMLTLQAADTLTGWSEGLTNPQTEEPLDSNRFTHFSFSTGSFG